MRPPGVAARIARADAARGGSRRAAGNGAARPRRPGAPDIRADLRPASGHAAAHPSRPVGHAAFRRARHRRHAGRGTLVMDPGLARTRHADPADGRTLPARACRAAGAASGCRAGHGLILLDEGLDEDEKAPAGLADRLAFTSISTTPAGNRRVSCCPPPAIWMRRARICRVCSPPPMTSQRLSSLPRGSASTACARPIWPCARPAPSRRWTGARRSAPTICAKPRNWSIRPAPR